MRIIDSAKILLAQAIDKADKGLLGGQTGITRKTDENGNPTGETENYSKVSVEISKGHGVLSKCQFDVKILDGVQSFNLKDVQEQEFYVKFDGLEVSYIDNRNVYLRAASYKVIDSMEVSQ